MKLSETQLNSMLEMQDGMNRKVNPNWILANNNWHRAIQVEGVEGIEHHGWKWWKKQECDMSQLRMELVDIWHFMLSAAIQSKNGHIDSAKKEMIEEMRHNEKFVNFDSQNYDLTQISLLKKLDLLVGLAASQRTNLALFESLLFDCEMNWIDLFRQYTGKNVLNFFRQDHGYKDGTYIKIWNGLEDNEHLVEILGAIDINSSNIRNEIYQFLESKYTLILSEQ